MGYEYGTYPPEKTKVCVKIPMEPRGEMECICYEARERDREEVWASNAIWEFTSVVVSRTSKLRALSDARAVFLPTRPVELPPAGYRKASGRSKWS